MQWNACSQAPTRFNLVASHAVNNMTNGGDALVPFVLYGAQKRSALLQFIVAVAVGDFLQLSFVPSRSIEIFRILHPLAFQAPGKHGHLCCASLRRWWSYHHQGTQELNYNAKENTACSAGSTIWRGYNGLVPTVHHNHVLRRWGPAFNYDLSVGIFLGSLKRHWAIAGTGRSGPWERTVALAVGP